MDFALNPSTGDLDIVNNTLYFVDGLDAIVQHVGIRFRFFFGEWFLDTSLGVPWFEDILIKAPSFAVVQEICKDVILDTPGIISLDSFDLNLDAGARTATLAFKATAESGEINFSQEIELPLPVAV